MHVLGKRRVGAPLCLLFIFLCRTTEGFVPLHTSIGRPTRAWTTAPKLINSAKFPEKTRPSSRSLQLHATAFQQAFWIKSTAVALVASFIFLVKSKRRWLWPLSEADPSYTEPLPPGTHGCPFVGFNILKGTRREGPERFFFKQSKKLGYPKLYKFYFLGRPVVNVSDPKMMKDLLNREFVTVGSNPPTQEEMEKRRKRPTIYSLENIAYERDREKHAFLRRLVGGGIQNSRPLSMLRQAANKTIESMQKQRSTNARMHDYSVDYTLEFVVTKLLGIDTDRKKVREELEIWMGGLNSILLAMELPLVNRFARPQKARKFLQEKIEEKIDLLEKNGPDGSILSSILFAVDEEHSVAKLTRSQVIGNALFLVAAGAETTAGTLTLAMFMLGLHPDKYRKLVEEQTVFVGEEVTEEQLQQSPYLDAVVKETLRMGPVSGTFPRKVRETLIVNGQQIPKGWSFFASIRLSHQLDPVTREQDQAHMDPMRGFRPERWLVDPEDQPQSFLPFGAGPRYCLGANLALLELKVFLATWARTIPSYTLPKQSSSRVTWNTRSLVPRPADGVVVALPKRKAETKPGVAHVGET